MVDQDRPNPAETEVLVEFAVTEQPVLRSLPSPEVLAEKSSEALDSAMRTIRGMAERVTTSIQELAARPSEVEVEFGLKLGTEGNAFLAKAGAEAQLTVKLKWGGAVEG